MSDRREKRPSDAAGAGAGDGPEAKRAREPAAP
ncbi:hypothetical protein CFC21_084169, partial [Triticum aestivum]